MLQGTSKEKTPLGDPQNTEIYATYFCSASHFKVSSFFQFVARLKFQRVLSIAHYRYKLHLTASFPRKKRRRNLPCTITKSDRCTKHYSTSIAQECIPWVTSM